MIQSFKKERLGLLFNGNATLEKEIDLFYSLGFGRWLFSD